MANDAAVNIATWDGMYASGRSLLQWPDEQVVSALERHRGRFATGIDIGCGAGRHTLLMAQMGIQATGIDSSPAGIEHGRSRAAAMGLAARTTFRTGLAQELDLPDAGFDVLICWGVIHYLAPADRATLVRTWERLLKPGGTLIVTIRSTRDTRAQGGVAGPDGSRRVEYFDSGSAGAKETVMHFWDEAGARGLLGNFTDVKLGHRAIEPVGKLGTATCHWLAEAVR